MNRLFATLVALFLFTTSFGQRLAQITLSTGGKSDIISFITDDAAIINVSNEGNVIDWGIEITGRYNSYPGKLYKYMGRVEYFSGNENEDYRGKVKYIGRTGLTYYTANENQAFKGKVKSIGTTFFDYYNSYEDEALKGKIKNAGVPFNYFRSFDNEAYKGKLKTVGSSNLTYYGSFDDKAFKGKIKSIDARTFTYYSSFDKQEYRGAMKGGYQAQYIINGIKYLLR